MSNHDHLEPLPEPSAPLMIHMAVTGVVIGALALCADVWITQGMLGFESPYIVIALAVMAVLAISGALKDGSVAVVMSFLTGILVGVLVANLVYVRVFDQQSMLTGVGL